MISPPLRVLRARQTLSAMVLLMNRTDPSPRRRLTPPGCSLDGGIWTETLTMDVGPPHHHPAHTGTGRAVGAGDVVVVGGRHVADAPGRTHPAVDHRGHTAGRVQRGALLKRVIDRHRASYLKHITTCLPLCRRGDTPALLHSCARQARTASGCWCTALAGLPHALIAPRARAGRRERR